MTTKATRPTSGKNAILKCLRPTCLHTWTQRKDTPPECCPKCKSYVYNQPRKG